MPVSALEAESLIVCCVVSAGDSPPPDGAIPCILAAYAAHKATADLWAAAMAGTSAVSWDADAAAPAFRTPAAAESRRLIDELAKVRARHPVA